MTTLAIMDLTAVAELRASGASEAWCRALELLLYARRVQYQTRPLSAQYPQRRPAQQKAGSGSPRGMSP